MNDAQHELPPATDHVEDARQAGAGITLYREEHVAVAKRAAPAPDLVEAPASHTMSYPNGQRKHADGCRWASAHPEATIR